MLFVDAAVASRLENGHAWRSIEYAEALKKLHPETPVAIQPVGEGYAIYAGPAAPVNGVKGLGLGGPVPAVDIDLIERFFRSRNAAPRVDLCPLADEGLLDMLGRRGYVVGHFHNMLVRELPDEDEPLPESDVRITVAEPDDEDLWLRVVAQGFDSLETPSAETMNMIQPTFHSASGVSFLAWIGDEAAGGGSIVTHGGVAELGSASTRVPFRRRGVQMALIWARMKAARELGCDLAILQTAPASKAQRNAERAGFRLAYTQLSLVCGAPPDRTDAPDH